MEVKVITFGSIKKRAHRLLKDRSNIPGMLGAVCFEDYNVMYKLPESELINKPAICLVQFRDLSNGEELYLVVKNRYENPWSSEVVTEDFVRFVETKVFGEREVHLVYDHTDLAQIVEQIEHTWIELGYNVLFRNDKLESKMEISKELADFANKLKELANNKEIKLGHKEPGTTVSMQEIGESHALINTADELFLIQSSREDAAKELHTLIDRLDYQLTTVRSRSNQV